MKWRATWTRGYSAAALEATGAMVPIQESCDGESEDGALKALLSALHERGLIHNRQLVIVQTVDLDADDDIPSFHHVTYNVFSLVQPGGR